MGSTYFKRFRMEIDLRGRDFQPIYLPPRFHFVPWDRQLLEIHAETKFLCFRSELDSSVFPCLADFPGCVRLMQEIAAKPGFLCDATWLLACTAADGLLDGYCGTIQGVIDKNGIGAIQNLGILPEYRARGLGEVLLRRSLIGFQRAGVRKVFLEVTAQNSGAVRLYKRVGFGRVRTVYKAAEVAYA